MSDRFWHSPGWIVASGGIAPLAAHLYLERTYGFYVAACEISAYLMDDHKKPADASDAAPEHHCPACKRAEDRAGIRRR